MVLLLRQKLYFWVGLALFLLSFLLLFIGVRVVLGNPVSFRNAIAFMGYAFLAGALGGVLMFFKMKGGLITFILGLGIGFFEMYRLFFRNLSGWGDLVGIMTLFMWSLLGLGIGLCVEVIRFILKRATKV